LKDKKAKTEPSSISLVSSKGCRKKKKLIRMLEMTKLILKEDKPLFPKLINHFWATKSLSHEHRSLVKFFGTIVM